MHRHINKQDRACIAQLLRKQYSYSAIARVLDLSPSTISREVRRNTKDQYDARASGRQARARRSLSRTKYRLIETNPTLEKTVQIQLKEKWSPEQIEHRTQLISDSSIYRYLERHWLLKKYLRRAGRRRRRYGTKRIPSRYQANKRSIHERPTVTSIGNREGDTIIGAERKLRIVTYVDKLSSC